MASSEDLKVVTDKQSAPKMEMKSDKPEPKFFDFGDVYFECNRCGNYECLQKGVKDGMQFVLPTSDQHEWRLVCGKCENMMRIFFKESDEATVIEAKAKIEAHEAQLRKEAEEEALEKARKEAKDEPKKKSKKKGSTERNTEDTSGATEPNGTGEPTLTIVD